MKSNTMATGCWYANPAIRCASSPAGVLVGRSAFHRHRNALAVGWNDWAFGLAVFDLLHSKANDERVFLYAFDLLELNGEDIRLSPLEERKDRLAKLLRHSATGIVLNQHIDGDGEMIFKHACLIGCESIVSKQRDRPYRSGRAKSWLKVKNPKSPAVLRIEDGTF